MDMGEYSGPTVVLLMHGEYEDRGPVGVFLDEDAAALELGRALLGQGQLLTGWKMRSPWGVERVLAPAMEAVEHLEQPDVEPAGVGRLAADQVARQCSADLAAALGLDQPGDWGDMCRQVRDARRAAEDDRAERVKVMNALHPGSGTNALAARVDLATWAELREQIRAQRERGGESFVAALRERLAPLYGSAAADGNRPALLGMVTSVVATAVRLLGDDPTQVQLDSEGVDRAARAHHAAGWRGEWESVDGDVQQRIVLTAERIIRAYLDEGADEPECG